jgi:hypothetical protein
MSELRMQTVHVRINDEATGQPTPCRIRFANAAGQSFAPFGRLTEFPTGRNQEVGGNVRIGTKSFAYIDGTCEVQLPVGSLFLEIHKGLEFTPQCLEVCLVAGKMALRLALSRWTNRQVERWYSGDMRCHYLSPHAALLEAAGEDLRVVNLLALEEETEASYGGKARSISNLLAFSGQRPCLEMPGHMVVVNTLNHHPVLGSLALLNCHRPVYPLRFGGAQGQDNWTTADWCDQCHRKRGLVVWARTHPEAADFAYGEPLADLILGKVDAYEMDFFEDSPFDGLADWYKLLNCGFRVPLVGASGKENNGLVLGAMRTYARLQAREDFTYKNWIEAIRGGRTIVTNGPLLSFSVNDQESGSTVSLPETAQSVKVQVTASSVVPFDFLEVVANGEVVAACPATNEGKLAVLETDVSVAASAWLAARCRGQHVLLGRPADPRVFAHTSPVYIQKEDRPLVLDSSALASLSKELERMRVWATREARCETMQQRERLAGILEKAAEKLCKRMMNDGAG